MQNAQDLQELSQTLVLPEQQNKTSADVLGMTLSLFLSESEKTLYEMVPGSYTVQPAPPGFHAFCDYALYVNDFATELADQSIDDVRPLLLDVYGALYKEVPGLDDTQKIKSAISALHVRATTFKVSGTKEPTLRDLINAILNPVQYSKLPPALRSSEYPVHTSQEIDAIQKAVSDGKTGAHWKNDPHSLGRTHQRPGATHYVSVSPNKADLSAGATTFDVDKLIHSQNADCIFTVEYILRQLAPPIHLPPNTTASGLFDLDDIAEKIGLRPDKQTEAGREAIRATVYEYIQFIECAKVIGRRSTQYKDKHTGKAIDTYIESALWRIISEKRPVQTAMFGETPRVVEIALPRDWADILTRPDMAQHLQAGEQLGAIPAGQPAGAWARVIGLALVNTWRRRPKEAVNAELLLTRHELLTRYLPKLAPVDEVLQGSNPKRAVDYWRAALAILFEQKIILRQGEAENPQAAERGKNGRELPRKGWQQEWLETPVRLVPGPVVEQNLQALAASRYEPAPRLLSETQKRKPGRPRKQPVNE